MARETWIDKSTKLLKPTAKTVLYQSSETGIGWPTTNEKPFGPLAQKFRLNGYDLRKTGRWNDRTQNRQPWAAWGSLFRIRYVLGALSVLARQETANSLLEAGEPLVFVFLKHHYRAK